MKLETVIENYDKNVVYIAKRTLYQEEMHEDVLDQLKEIERFWMLQMFKQPNPPYDKAAQLWIMENAKEWRNKRNYERFYKETK